MADFLDCPSCQRRLRVPAEVIGQLVKCPGCGRTFRAGADGSIPAPAAPPPPVAIQQHVTPAAPASPSPPGSPFAFEQPPAPFDDDFAERRQDVGSVDDWTKVRTGLTLMLASYLIVVGAAVLGCCGAFVLGGTLAGGGSGRGGADASMFLGFGLVMILVLGVALISVVLRLIGQVMCIWAPGQFGARSLAIASLALNLLAISLGMCGGLVGALESPGGRPPPGLQTSGGYPTTSTTVARSSAGPLAGNAVSALGNLIGLLEMFVFLFYLRAVARCIHNHSMVVTIRQLLILAGTAFVLVAGTVVVFIGAGVSAGAGSDVMQGLGILGLGLMCTAGVLMLVYFIWYLVALSQMRDALTRYVRTRGG